MKNRLGVLALVLGFIFLLGLAFGFLLPRMAGLASGPRIISTPTVLKQIQTLSELVTVKYVMEKIEVYESGSLGVLGETRVSLLAHGIVKAGVDFREMKTNDIAISGKKISLRLPPSQVTDAYLDESQTKVLDHTTGLFRVFD